MEEKIKQTMEQIYSGNVSPNQDSKFKINVAINLDNMQELTRLLLKHDELIKQVSENLDEIRQLALKYNITVR